MTKKDDHSFGVINEYLNERADELMLYKWPRNEELIGEISSFNPQAIESLSSAKVSQYALGLSQYLIFLSSQIGATKVKLMRKRKVLDYCVNMSELKSKTKAEKLRKVVDSDPELKNIEMDIEALECELIMVEGYEKSIYEYINVLKRELTRREQEQKFVRDERRL